MNVEHRPRDEVTLEGIRDRLRAFADARDWNQFHTPKNLAIALSVEAGDLLSIFSGCRKTTAICSADKLSEVEEEMADVLLYLIAGFC